MMQHLERWHQLLRDRDPAGLGDLLADDVVFHSPVVHRPQAGKAITTVYLTAALHVLLANGFHYVREVVDGQDAVLEFMAEIDGIVINGVDLIHFDADGRIDDFKVMVRPAKAMAMLQQQMAAMLEKIKR
ncbi:MAG: nuclear transport factor 2 family protein [Pseudomonadota bacterium]